MREKLPFWCLLLCFTMASAQVTWTGTGDGYSWDDPNNWDTFDVPQDGDDVYIDNGWPIYYGSGYYYNSVTITNNSNVLLEADLFVSGDFTVGPTSTLSVTVAGEDEDYYSSVYCGTYYMNGDVDILFSTYVPTIGSNYDIIQGSLGSCGSSSSDFIPESQASGFETTLAVFCLFSGVNYEVTDINYTTAVSWDGEAGDGDWSNPANWDPNGVPTANDVVILNNQETVYTNSSGVTQVKQILVGDYSELHIQGSMELLSVIGVNPYAYLYWEGGSLLKTDPNVQSFILNRGGLEIGYGSFKTLEDGFGISNQDYGYVVIYDDFNINDGYFTNYSTGYVDINSSATIGYDSGSSHVFANYGTMGSLVFSSLPAQINLPSVTNGGSIEARLGTLSFGEGLTNYGELMGGGNFQLPNSLVIGGSIVPEAGIGLSRSAGNTGTLTFIGNLNTSPSAAFVLAIDAEDDFDKVMVTGTANLSGLIVVDLNYLPANDAIFEIISTGTLASNNLPSQVVANYNGTLFTFQVLANNNSIYLLGPSATLSTPNFTADEVKVYPNPAHSFVTVQTTMPIDGRYALYTQLGQLVAKGTLNGSTNRIELNNLASGMYVLQVQDSQNQTVKVEKLMVSK